MIILISDAFDPSLAKKLSRFGEVTDDTSRQAEADVVLIRSKTKVNKEYMDSAPNLKLVIRGGVGLDNVDLETAHENGIAVHNTPAASSIAVAELTFALMIALPNHLPKAHQSMTEGKWLKKELKRTELYGKTLGIVGCGRIGHHVAERAQAFGMTVLGYDKADIQSDIIDMQDSLEAMLPRCDFVTLNLPLNDSTKGLINAQLLQQFKKGAYLINSGRGKTVLEQDVVDALESGQLAGFATDVWYSDPPEDTPLLNASNVVLTPHIGASTRENLLRIGDIVESIIDDFVNS